MAKEKNWSKVISLEGRSGTRLIVGVTQTDDRNHATTNP